MTKPRPGDDRRRRARRQQQAQTAAERERAARQREINRALRVWTPRRILGWSLIVVGVVVGVVHWLAHIGWRPIPLAMGAQDLFIGYPAAGLLVIAAAIILGQNPKRS